MTNITTREQAMSSIWAKEPDRINIINSLLHDICSYLNEKATDTDPSLYRGLAGQLLFQWNLRKYNESLVDLTRFEKKFDMFQSQMSDLKDISFGKGLSGCCWLLELLSAEADEAEYDQEINRDFELYLAETFSDHQWSGDYELVFGLAGYAAFCRRRFINNPHEKAYRSILETLTRSAVNTKDGLSWSTPVSSALRFNCSSDNEFNLGVAHGVGSAIATLSFALPLIGDEWQQIKGILERSCQCLLANHNSPEASTFFGYYAGQTCETRLGWCYGDLSAAWVLSNAASALKDEAMLSRAKEIALASTHRTLQDRVWMTVDYATAVQVCFIFIVSCTKNLVYLSSMTPLTTGLTIHCLFIGKKDYPDSISMYQNRVFLSKMQDFWKAILVLVSVY